jgi:hypothetical protein
MKHLIILAIGIGMGVFGTVYYTSPSFKAQTNAHIDSAVAEGATAAHTALTAPVDSSK